MLKRLVLGLLLAFLCFPGKGWTEAPMVINFQGKLTELTNVPVADGPYDMKFSIYDSETDAATSSNQLVWTEIWDATTVQVNITNGIFNVLLGSTTASGLANVFTGAVGETRWLQVEVYDSVTVTWDILGKDQVTGITTRKQLTSVPYSIHSANASNVNCAAAPCVDLATEATGTYDDTPDTIADDGWITQGEVNFPYAGSASMGGAASSALTAPWSGITGIPTDFSDGIDNVGITGESDPKVGTLTNNKVPKWSNTGKLVDSSINDNGAGVGITTPLNVSGTVTATDVTATGTVTSTDVNATDVTATGTIAATSFVGDGSQLTGISAGGGGTSGAFAGLDKQSVDPPAETNVGKIYYTKDGFGGNDSYTKLLIHSGTTNRKFLFGFKGNLLIFKGFRHISISIT